MLKGLIDNLNARVLSITEVQQFFEKQVEESGQSKILMTIQNSVLQNLAWSQGQILAEILLEILKAS